MTDIEFAGLFEIGDFVIYCNMICIVESFGEGKVYHWVENSEFMYKVSPLFNPLHLEKSFSIIADSNFKIRKATDEYLIEQMASYMEEVIDIDDVSVYISDTNLSIAQDEGFIHLEPSQAIELKKIIDKYVVEL